jgi:uncharacterized OB-fold protein
MDEGKYPTRRFMRCRKCGQVFAGGPYPKQECPECSSADTEEYDASSAEAASRD